MPRPSRATPSGMLASRRLLCHQALRVHRAGAPALARPQLQRDLDDLKAAARRRAQRRVYDHRLAGRHLLVSPNQYYPIRSCTLEALSEAMQAEYESIVHAGFVLQLDCPDLTGLSGAGPSRPETGRPGPAHRGPQHAVRNIFRSTCACTCAGATTRARTIWTSPYGSLPEVLTAHPAGLSFEGANPRHEHEWNVFDAVSLPDGKYFIPGV